MPRYVVIEYDIEQPEQHPTDKWLEDYKEANALADSEMVQPSDLEGED